jgi:RNA polymerase sigma-70 factor, ECF subfamily
MESDTAERGRRFTELYERCYGSVYAYAARRAGRESADEIAAETFVIAWRRFESLPSEPLPWLFGVARNVLHRARRRLARLLGATEQMSSSRFRRSDYEPIHR